MNCRLVSSSSNVTLDDVAVITGCCPSSRDSSLDLLVLVFVSGDVSFLCIPSFEQVLLVKSKRTLPHVVSLASARWQSVSVCVV